MLLGSLRINDVVSEAYKIIESVNVSSSNFILSTSFGHHSPVLLKLVTDVAPNTPIVWVDSGYNTKETYRYCEQLKERLNLNLHIYHPQRSVMHRSAIGTNPNPEEEGYDEFISEIKLEPFKRALSELQPSHWLTGIREEETDYRRSLGVESEGPNGIKKIAPLFHWQEVDLDKYMIRHSLPFALSYQDLAKPRANQECGLHCRL